MKIRKFSGAASLGAALLAAALAGCAGSDQMFCAPQCHTNTHNASSLVGFLYPDGVIPPAGDTVSVLHVPLRVGLAFLPSQGGAAGTGLDAAHKAQILDRIRERFADRKFVSEIVVIPDYYLTTKGGFEGLAGVQSLYNIDVMALVSYDQVTHLDQNKLSLAYLTIVGAYVLKGTDHDTATLVDLAVVDPATRTLLLRAGGTDERRGSSTLVEGGRNSRVANSASFDAASARMLDNFDAELEHFRAAIREGTAPVRVVRRGDAQ